MTKRTIKETIREYDENGKVIKETVTETTEDDDTPPAIVYNSAVPEWWKDGPTCTCESK